MSNEEFPNYSELLRNNIMPIDLLILNELVKGTPESRIPERIKEELGISISKTTVGSKIREMKNRGIIKKVETAIVDPSKLYPYIYLAFIKTNLRSQLVPAAVITWRDAFEKIKEINKKFGYPIRMLFNVGGTGEYDFVAIIYTNDPRKYHEFKEELVRSTGIIEKYDTKYVDVPELFHFDPISVPDFRKYSEWIKRTHKTFEKWLKKEATET
jgi:DNA-binding Lrp family transcriptional regulator